MAYGYIKRNPDDAIRFRTKIPDHEGYGQPIQHEWASTVYGNDQEELPSDMPAPK
jgi:hypothetical protein